MLRKALPLVLFGFAVALPAHAAVFVQQSDASTEIDFVNQSGSFIGYPGDVFTLPAMTGLLRAFDIYLSMSSYSLSSNNAQGSPVYVTIALGGGADCPTSAGTDQNGGTYLVSDLGTPVTTSNTLPAPTINHFVLSGTGNIPTYSGQTDCTIQITQNGTNDAKKMATMGSTTLAAPMYFVGYDALGVPPTLTAVSVASNNASTTLAKAGDTVTLTFTVDRDVQTPQVTIAGHAASVATTTGDTFEASTTLTSADTEGPVAFSILTTNLVGDNGYNTSTTTDNSSVTLDHTAPTVTITSGPADLSTSTSSPTTFAWSVDDASAAVTCAWDGSATSTCAGTSTQALADGAHTFAVLATDTSGNTGSSTRSFTVDAAAPALSIDSGPAQGATIATSSVAFTFTADASSTVACSYDGATTTGCTSPFATTSPDGSHTFAVAAVGTNGVTSYLSRTFTIDTAPPALATSGSTSRGDNGPAVGSLPPPVQSTLSPAASGSGTSGGGSVIPTAPTPTPPVPTPTTVSGQGSVATPVVHTSHPSSGSAQPSSETTTNTPPTPTSSVVVAGSSTQAAAVATAQGTTSWVWLALGGLAGAVVALILLFITSW